VPADLNRVTLSGRLTRDPELRQTQGGEPVCALRLATNGRARDEAGRWGEQPHYFDVRLFGRPAERAAAHLARGRRVGVDGRLSWREWEAKDGGRRQAVEIVAQALVYLDAPPPAGPQPEPVGAAGGEEGVPLSRPETEEARTGEQEVAAGLPPPPAPWRVLRPREGRSAGGAA